MTPLQQREQEWQITFDAIRDLVMILDDEFRIVRVNAAAISFFDLPLEKILGSHCYSLMHGTTSPLPGCPFEKAIRTRKHAEAEICDAKTDRWLLASADPILDEDGSLTGVVHTVRDITENKRAGSALAESEERFRLATEAIRGIVYDVELSGKTFFCSEGLTTVLGYQPTEVPLTLAWWRDQLHPEDRDRVFRQLEEAFAQRLSARSYEYRVRHKDGRYIWVEDKHRIIYANDGRAARLIGCTASIDARRDAEQQLKDSEQRLRLAAETARMFAFEWDPRTDRAVRSAECETILGADIHRNTGQAYIAAIHPDDRVNALHTLRELSPANPEYRLAYRMIRSDGQVVWLEEVSHGFFDEEGRLIRLVGMTADVTERRRTEEEKRRLRDEMVRMSRISAMGELTATIAHELNQPLGAIITNAQACQRLLNRPDPDLAEIRTALAEMVTDASRAHEVVGRVREFLRRGEAEKAQVDLNAIVRSVVPMLQGRVLRNHVELTLDLDPHIPPVTAGFGQLQQVVFNLTLNAVEAVLPLPVSSRKVGIVSRRLPDGRLSIAVTDSGVGIPTADMNRLFDLFFTTKPEGTGMGLSICKSIVEAHGGRLWAESDGRNGAVFQFAIPPSGAALP